MGIKIDSDLVKGLFGSEVRLVVEVLVLMLRTFPRLLLGDLGLEELAICSVLVLAILLLQILHLVHIVEGRVELMLFSFASLLNIVDLLVEALESLLVDFADRFERVGALVHPVVVNAERTLGAHEFRNGRVVVVRNSFAIEGHLDVRKLI